MSRADRAIAHAYPKITDPQLSTQMRERVLVLCVELCLSIATVIALFGVFCLALNPG
jgi:hypothetical protein